MVKNRSGKDPGQLRRIAPGNAATHAALVLFFRAAKSLDPDYYLRDDGVELAHLGEPQRAPLGAASFAYFPSGIVDEAGFHRLILGQPIGALHTLASARREVATFELLAVAPKPISVMALLGDDAHAQQIVIAHHDALHGAIAYLEQHAVATRHHENERVDAISGVRFTHGVSRSLDPHLHSHVVIANLGRAESGRFGALDQRGFRAHLDAASALYDAHLSGRVRALGLPTKLTPLAQAVFSTRQAEARQLRFERGVVHRGAFGDDAQKQPTTRGDLLLRWEHQLRIVGLARDDLVQPVHEQRPPQRRLDEQYFAQMLLSDDRRITRRKVVEAWGWASGGAAARDVDAAINLFVDRPPTRFEQELREADVLTTARERRVFGNRPLDAEELRRWLTAARHREYSAPLRHLDLSDVRSRELRRSDQGWSR